MYNCYNIYIFINMYLQIHNKDNTPAINISPTQNKFEFFKEEPSSESQFPIQTSQSFANFDNNPAFSTYFDNSKNIGMYIV